MRRLDDMQGQLTALKNRNSEVSVSIASIHSEVGEASDEDPTLQDTSNSKKRDRSPSPDDTEDDTLYRQTLAAVRSLLDLSILDEFSEQPSQIFGSKLKDKCRSSLLPMVMPPVDGVLERWDFYEKKSAGNTQQDQPHLKTNPLNFDNYLYFTTAPLKYYKSTSTEFSFQVPRCQDSFRSSFPGPMPSSVRVPLKQHTLLETVNREHVQILSYVHFFLNAIEKMTNKLETTMLGVKNSTRDHAVIKELDSMLSGLHIQFSCISSIEKALENVTDNLIAAACNLQLARRDTVLKSLAPDLNEHDFNRLRRTGFKSHDLFCPTVLNKVEKKIQKSPKRPRTDNKSSFSFKRKSDDRSTGEHQSSYTQKNFRDQNLLPSKNPASTLPSLPEKVEVSVGDYSVVVHHGGRLQHFWQVWENLYCHPSCANLEVGLSNPTPIESAHVCISHNSNDRKNMATYKIVCYKCFKKRKFTISRIAQRQVVTADSFLYRNPAKSGGL